MDADCKQKQEEIKSADVIAGQNRSLTDDEKQRLAAQDTRLLSEYKALKLELNAQRNWDLFYKRNETRFFKDRHWTTREFKELLDDATNSGAERRRLLEIGCGVGNLVFPLIEEQCAAGAEPHFYYYACDFSPRAVEFVRNNPLYDERHITAFQCDITAADAGVSQLGEASLDVCTLIFVLSAIHPTNFARVVDNLWRLLRPGGVVLFRDYGRYDMAQLRFKPGSKIAENLYMRQDGTRSYYFDVQELAALFEQRGFRILCNEYVHRRTLNVKEGIDVPRIFLQGKFQKS